MAGKLFDKLEREAFRGGIQARTKESQRWFRSRVASLKSVNRTEILRDARQRARPIFGDMYMMMYDPKHKQVNVAIIDFLGRSLKEFVEYCDLMYDINKVFLENRFKTILLQVYLPLHQHLFLIKV